MRSVPATHGGPASEPYRLLKLLSNEVRWEVVAALALSDRKVNELVDRVGQPANLVSYHLGQLRGARVVSERRSSADARDVYYSLDLQRLQVAFERCVGAIHPGLWPDSSGSAAAARAPGFAASPARVLFVCTHNSARSQMAEAIMRHQGGASVEVRSAGSHPSHVHPLATKTLIDLGINADGLNVKPLDSFAGERFDYVITLCDIVREACPSWPAEPEQVHWSLADPSLADASEEAALLAFRGTAVELTRRISYFMAALAKRQDNDAA